MATHTKLFVLLALPLMSLFITSCGTVRETLPTRTAREMMLLSTSADRALVKLPANICQDKKVFVSAANLESYDQKYVMQKVRDVALSHGALLVADAKDSQVILEVASGGLSIDKQVNLLGLPEIPISVPFAGEMMSPEVPIIKRAKLDGRAKILVSAIDTKTKKQVIQIPVMYGGAYVSEWWFLFIGPFRSSDLPKPEYKTSYK